MVYFGGTKLARPYFEEMGFVAMNRQTTPDFLVAVTDPYGRSVKKGYEKRVPRNADEMVAHYKRSQIAAGVQREMEEYYTDYGDRRRHRINRKSSSLFSTIGSIKTIAGNTETFTGDLDSGYDEKDMVAMTNMTNKVESYKRSARAELSKGTLKGSPYMISIPMQMRAVMTRRVKILKGDWITQLVVLISYVFMAIIMGTLFLRVEDSTAAYFSRGGVLFL